MNNKISKKIVLIGAGSVGCSFLYSAINQGLASDYVLIDAFPQAAEGNALDLADAMAVLPNPVNSIKAGCYEDCKDADIVVITAGRPQIKKPDGTLETRLEMVSGNAVIMKDIATKVKLSGFNGITIIASNPVDVLTLIYQQVTGFDQHKVIGSGTTLDSARMRRLIGDKLNINSQAVQAFIIGEHGDSSVPVWSNATIFNKPINEYVNEEKISQNELDNIHMDAVKMAYKIIELKKATFYGIGVCLSKIAKAVLNNENIVLMAGAKLNGEYGNFGVYTGVPCLLNENGWVEIIKWNISSIEQEKFNRSILALKETIVKAEEAIK